MRVIALDGEHLHIPASWTRWIFRGLRYEIRHGWVWVVGERTGNWVRPVALKVVR